jgi:hypothetical protein
MPLAAPHFSQFSDARWHGAVFSGVHGPRQRPGYRVTPKLSLSCPMQAGKSRSQFKKRLRRGEASGIRRDTDGDDQKKAYEKQIFD